MSDEFRQATDRLIDSVTLADLAGELDVSHGLLRQARLSTSASSYRSPPAGWKAGVAKLAREQASALLKLASDLEGE